jgi:GTP cyclohydrolase II
MTKTHSSTIQRIAEFVRPTVFGPFNVISYNKDGSFDFAVNRGDLPQENLLVRIQSHCLFVDSFGFNS